MFRKNTPTPSQVVDRFASKQARFEQASARHEHNQEVVDGSLWQHLNLVRYPGLFIMYGAAKVFHEVRRNRAFDHAANHVGVTERDRAASEMLHSIVENGLERVSADSLAELAEQQGYDLGRADNTVVELEHPESV